MAEDILDNEMSDEEYLAHYGTPRHSGRYPWGSGEDPYQHEDWYNGKDGEYKPQYKTPEEFLIDYKEMETAGLSPSRARRLKEQGVPQEDIDRMKETGITEKDIADMLDVKTRDLRAIKAIAINKREENLMANIIRLQDEGLSKKQIAEELGLPNESSVRSKLNPNKKDKSKVYDVAALYANAIKKGGKGARFDISEGMEAEFGLSDQEFQQVRMILYNEYHIPLYTRRYMQPTNIGKGTSVMIACAPGTAYGDVYNDKHAFNVKVLKSDGSIVEDKKEDEQEKFLKPEVVARNRVQVIYDDDPDNDNFVGVPGSTRDGLIELRAGAEDLSLQGSSYAQVRIPVADENGKPKYYLKGMAVVSNDLPEGVDIRFWSNRKHDQPDVEVFKKLKKNDDGEIDWENPFKSTIKPTSQGGQYTYIGKDGKEHVSPVCKKSDAGDWDEWSRKLPAQFLSKQDIRLIRRQMKETLDERRLELERINSMTSRGVKLKFLEDYAGGCDSLAVHLSAAALPRQSYHVILPNNTLKENEIYAPNFENGEKVCLIRFPHAGPFEIPYLTVNNKNKSCKEMLGNNPQDAVCINYKAAQQLSGADFDGDTAIVVPVDGDKNDIHIKTEPYLEGLIGFDDKAQYPPVPKRDENGEIVRDKNGEKIVISPVMPEKSKGNEMGKITNLIADMTLQGAERKEIERAVKYSMIVVDAPKHKLDYKRAYKELEIEALKDKYMTHSYVDSLTGEVKEGKGAATIITRARGQAQIYARTGRQKIDPETGLLVWPEWSKVKENTEFVDKKGKLHKAGPRIIKDYWMNVVTDANELIRNPDNKVEVAYAEYANALKGLANEARLEMLNLKGGKRNPSAARIYANEVLSLEQKYAECLKAKSSERAATILANALIAAYESENGIEDGEWEDTSDKKKFYQKCLTKARAVKGSKRPQITLTQNEWDAIEAGAFSLDKLKKYFAFIDEDTLRMYAMPKDNKKVSAMVKSRVASMQKRGYTTEEIAKSVGLSTSAVKNIIYGKDGED